MWAKEGRNWEWRLRPGIHEGHVILWPSEIGFTQDSISLLFRDGRSLQASFDEGISLCGKRRRCAEIPPMQVVFIQGQYFSLNNRRLAVYRLLEMRDFLRDPVKAIVTAEPERLKQKFTTKCDGEWVSLRGDTAQWIGRDLDETNCWEHRPRLGVVGQLVHHQEEGLGRVLGPAQDSELGDLSVEFQHSTQDAFTEFLQLHCPGMNLAHKRNFISRALHLGIKLCQNKCACGCGEDCGRRVCVCGCCDTPFHNDGLYCCDCAEELGLDLNIEDPEHHRHAGHAECHSASDSE